MVKIGGANSYERCVYTRQDCLVHNSRWVTKFSFVLFFFTNILLYSQFLAYTGCIAVKQLCVPYANISTLAMIPTYSRILSAIKKVFQELMEEYQGVKKSLWDLVEG